MSADWDAAVPAIIVIAICVVIIFQLGALSRNREMNRRIEDYRKIYEEIIEGYRKTYTEMTESHRKRVEEYRSVFEDWRRIYLMERDTSKTWKELYEREKSRHQEDAPTLLNFMSGQRKEHPNE